MPVAHAGHISGRSTPPRWSVTVRSALRAPRAVQLLSRAIGEHIYHPSGEHARIRNAIMRAKTSEDYYGDLARGSMAGRGWRE